MSFTHLLKFLRLFVFGLALFCFYNAETFAQVQSLSSELTPPTRVALGADLIVKVTATPVSGTLPAIETAEWVGKDGFFSLKSTAPQTGVPQDGVYSFTLKAEKLTDAREITV